MVIFYNKNQGLMEGIQQGGTALAQALGQGLQARGKQQNVQAISSKLSGKPINLEALIQIAGEPGGMEYLTTLGSILGPVIKEQARSQGAGGAIQNVLSQLLGGEGASSSPIDEARQFQTPAEDGLSPQPPTQDSNRLGPREQTVYEQGGQAGMGLNPPQQGRQFPGTQPTPQMGRPGDMSRATPEQKEKAALALSTLPYQEARDLARILNDQAKEDRAQLARREERTFKLNTPLYEGIASARRSLPEKAIALERIDDAIQSGDINRFIDFAADRLGMDPLKSTQAQILESAVKTFFLEDLKSIQGGRLNQLIEGNLLKAFQNIGKSPEANQEITETLYAIEDIVNERIKIFDKISDTYDKAGRELPRNVDKMIDDELNPFVKDKLSELNKVRKELRQGKVRSNSAVQMRRAQRQANDTPPPEGTKWVLAPDGHVEAIPLNELNAAKKAGGRIVNE